MTWPTTLPGIYPKYYPLFSLIILFVMKNYKKLSKIAMTSSNSRSNKFLLNWPKSLHNSLHSLCLVNGCNAFAMVWSFWALKINLFFGLFWPLGSNIQSSMTTSKYWSKCFALSWQLFWNLWANIRDVMHDVTGSNS